MVRRVNYLCWDSFQNRSFNQKVYIIIKLIKTAFYLDKIKVKKRFPWRVKQKGLNKKCFLRDLKLVFEKDRTDCKCIFIDYIDLFDKLSTCPIKLPFPTNDVELNFLLSILSLSFSNNSFREVSQFYDYDKYILDYKLS